MLKRTFLLVASLIIFLSAACQRDQTCPDDDRRENMPVTTPIWPDGVSMPILTGTGDETTLEDVVFPLWERIPEALTFADGTPMSPGIILGCDGSNLGANEHSLWIEYSGPCSDYKIYHELYGVASSRDLWPPYLPDDCNKYDYALIPGFSNPNSEIDDVCNYVPYNEDQMTLCGTPVIKNSNSGGEEYRYHVVVGSTSRVYQTSDTNTPINYRIQIVARDLFPWIRSFHDLHRGSCSYNSQLEMFVNFTSRVDIED